MDNTDKVDRTLDHSVDTELCVGGAVCYVLWGCLHLWAAYAVYQVGAAVAPGMVRGRVFQDTWNLLFFGATAIIIALTLNVRNRALGYWINLGVLALADTGLIIFVLIPGYIPLWPGLAGPVLWVLGGILTTLAYFRRDSAQLLAFRGGHGLVPYVRVVDVRSLTRIVLRTRAPFRRPPASRRRLSARARGPAS